MSISKWGLPVLLVCIAGALFYCFPLFHVLPLDQLKQQRQSKAFDPKAFAERFWDDQLMTSLDRAVDASELFAAIRRDRRAAKREYAQTFGIGDVYDYFIAGEGRVVSIDDESKEVAVSLGDDDSTIHLLITTRNIVGNAIRNATNLIDADNFPNSRDFNNLSVEINRIVESRVLPPFRDKALPGARVKFVGCAEIMDEDRDLHPMRITPVDLKIL